MKSHLGSGTGLQMNAFSTREAKPSSFTASLFQAAAPPTTSQALPGNLPRKPPVQQACRKSSMPQDALNQIT
jgi:hypothetical protein